MTTPQVMTPLRGQTPIHPDAIHHLEHMLRGDLIRPGDARYDGARRVYNAAHDRRPALIVRAAGVADVRATVRTAREHDTLLAVRGGGHSVPGFGTCDGGIVLDLNRMRGVRIDRERRTVRAEGGCTWGDVDHATHAFGCATPGGIVSTTGIAGLTLGGGMGHLVRSCGLSCDNLVSADVVTVDGRFLTCSEDQHPDLFWAIRGGGGNFGVVTSFEYRLHSVAEILGGPTFYPLDGEPFRGYLDLIAEAPEQLNAIFGITLGPSLPFLPEQWHGKPVTVVLTCWSGPPAEDDGVRSRLSRVGKVIGQYVGRMPYPAINTLFDELLPPGLYHYWKGCFAEEITEGAIDVHLEYGATIPCVQTATLIFPINGACHRVASHETAFAYRNVNFATGLGPSWPNPEQSAANIAWGRAYHEALRAHSLEGGYVNFMSGDDQEKVRANYAGNFERLRKIKMEYDPTNLLRLNQNIGV